MKILTVDDSKTIRMIVTKALRAFDCAVLEAENGVVGLAVAARERPDLILLDYTMPVMDGFEVLARLRSDPDLKTTPVIMLTAEAGRETVLKIARLGVRDYLIKPFKEDLLLERVKRVVGLQPRVNSPSRARRFDDPIQLLVLDDKPAIAAQVRNALVDTPWQVSTASQPGEALDACAKGGVDLVLASLSLPNEAAFAFFQNIRGLAATASIPVFGMAVRTAAAEQARAQQAGFAGILGKPIDADDLKSKVSRTLKLDTSYRYFLQQESALILTIPKEPSQAVLQDISGQLQDQLTKTAEAGSDRLFIDLSPLSKVTLPIAELMVNASQLCEGLLLKIAIVANASLKSECVGYEEVRPLTFVESLGEALHPPADAGAVRAEPALA